MESRAKVFALGLVLLLLTGNFLIILGFDGQTSKKNCLSCSDERLILSGNYWTSKKPAFTERQGPACTEYNGMVYAIGGWGNSSTQNTFERYDPATNTWHNSPTHMPTPRYHFDAVTVNGKIYAIGGRNMWTFYDVAEVYDPVGNSWSTVQHMFTQRSALATVEVNGIIYAIGGWNNGVTYDTVEAYNPVNNTWWKCKPLPSPREGVGAAVVNGIIYAIGGRLGSTYPTTVYAYSPSNNIWWSVAPMPGGKAYHGVDVINGVIYAVSGANSVGNTNACYAYNPANNTWWQIASIITARGALSAATANGKLYAVGGLAAASIKTNEEYTPDSFAPGVPSAPWNLVADGGDAVVNLSWFAPSSSGGKAISSYTIYRDTAPNPVTLLQTIGNVTSYQDTAVTNGVTYYYKVSAVNSIGEGAKSNEAIATPSNGISLSVLLPVILAIVVIAIAAIVVFIYYRKKRQKQIPAQNPQYANADQPYNQPSRRDDAYEFDLKNNACWMMPPLNPRGNPPMN